MRTLIEIWLSDLRLAVRVRMSGATNGLVHLLRVLLLPAAPRTNIPGPAVGGRRVAGLWVLSPETASAVFVATTTIAFARRQHLLRRASTYLSK